MTRATLSNIDPKVEVGIVCALDLEATPIVRRLGNRLKTIASGFTVTCGLISGRHVAVARSDAGRKRLAAATEALLSVHRPKWLIAAGFAVGLSDGVMRGELVVANELVNDVDERQEIDGSWSIASKLDQGAKTGRLLSVTVVPRSAAQKRGLFVKTSAIAVDQHSWSLAKWSSEQGVRFLAVHVIADDSQRDAEPESRAVFHPSASYRAGGVVGAFVRGSGHVGKIWRIRSEAKRHAERLAEFLARLVPTLEC